LFTFFDKMLKAYLKKLLYHKYLKDKEQPLLKTKLWQFLFFALMWLN